MTAGVPGLGIGGLFALFSALLIPLMARTSKHLQRTEKKVRRTLWLQAMAIVVTTYATWELAGIAMGFGDGDRKFSGLPVFLVSIGLLLTVLAFGRVQLALQQRRA